MVRPAATRLFVLGLLERHGPLHGHALQRMAHQDHTDLWTEVRAGSLYAALRQMEGEELVAVERTEREGRLPTRTVYRVTPAGRAEFRRLRLATLRDARLRPDPADLAVALSDDLPASELAELLAERHRQLLEGAAGWRQLRAKAWPHLSAAERLVFAHYEHRYEAELAWHRECTEALAMRLPDPSRPEGELTR